MNDLNTGRRLLFIVIANLLSASLLNLLMNLLSSQPAPMPAVLSIVIVFVGLSFGLYRGFAWTRLVAGVLAAVYASTSLFYGINLITTASPMAIVFIFIGAIFLISALILFGAQSLRSFMAHQREKFSG